MRLRESLRPGLQENKPLIGWAMFSGFCIYFGNLAEQYALALAGVTIAVPVFSSCIVVLGAHPAPSSPAALPRACSVVLCCICQAATCLL